MNRREPLRTRHAAGAALVTTFARGLMLAVALLASTAARAEQATATFAGGCFWCMEPPFEALGVESVTSGYTGGRVANPAYEQVSAGSTGHAESVQVVYDPAKVRYEELLDVFWHNVDPTAVGAQFCDVGSQYRSAIFVHDAQLREVWGSEAPSH